MRDEDDSTLILTPFQNRLRAGLV